LIAIVGKASIKSFLHYKETIMKKHLFCLLPSLVIYLLAFSQPNHMISNTATSFTLNAPCAPAANGTYTVQINYFDLSIGDWVPGPDNNTYTDFTGVMITDIGNGDILYDFSNASPVPDFPLDMSTSQGWIRIPATGAQMNWDNHQLNCPSLPVDLTSFTGHLNNCNVDLQFVTADEYDMVQYVIERNGSCIYAFDATVCTKTPFNDNHGHTYNCTDYSPIQGGNYYRLKMIGLSGYVKYSNVVLVKATSCGPQPYEVNCSGVGISGPSLICDNTAEYALTNVPNACLFNNTYTWSIDNTNIATVSNNNAPSATINRWGNGTAYLTVTLSGCSNATKTHSFFVELGKRVEGAVQSSGPTVPLINENSGSNYVNQGTVSVQMYYPNATPSWSYIQGNVNYWYMNNNLLFFDIPGGGYAIFKLDISTPCGLSSEYYMFEANGGYFRSSPNPAQSSINVYMDEEMLRKRNLLKSADQSIREIVVIDKGGNIVMQRKFSGAVRKAQLNVNNLRPDIYFIRIYNGKTWEAIKFIKK
jgi:hypothetical protein